jgi:histidine triad (HIT) family protein
MNDSCGMEDNIFAKIVKKELPADIIYENDYVVAFKDINPVAPVHILLIPKKQYNDVIDFVSNGSEKEIATYYKSMKEICDLLDLKHGSFRMISNNGTFSGQTVMYFHTHIIGGKELKELV